MADGISGPEREDEQPKRHQGHQGQRLLSARTRLVRLDARELIDGFEAIVEPRHRAFEGAQRSPFSFEIVEG